MAKDHYQILGLQKNASKDDIKKAFRKMDHKYHPDKKGGDEKKFKEANEAYNILSNDKKRKEYDAYGRAFSGFSGQNAGPSGWDFSQFTEGGAYGFTDFDLGDIFSDFFGGRGRGRSKRGSDISIDIEVSFYDSVFGTERKIILKKNSHCEKCGGSGARPGSAMEKCKVCNGKGKIVESARSIFGNFSTERVCRECSGSGEKPKEKCEVCHGHGILKKEQEIEVKIPAGIEDGQMIRLSGAGESIKDGPSGDLYIKIHVKPDANFKKERNNLVTTLNIKITDAILGAEYALKTLDGNIKVKIPEGVSFGEILRVKGKGVPNRSGRGDLFIKLNIELPKKLSSKAKKILGDLKNEGL